MDAPFVPQLRSITDTRFFPTDELENVPDSPALVQAMQERENEGANAKNVKADLPFIGYTYSRFDYLTRKGAIWSTNKSNGLRKEKFQKLKKKKIKKESDHWKFIQCRTFTRISPTNIQIFE